MTDSYSYASDNLEDDGVLEPADDLTTDDLEDDPLDTGIIPADRYRASTWFGVTDAEARQGETLDQLLAEEEPDPSADFFDEEDEEDQEAVAGRGRDLDEDDSEEIADEVGEFGDGGPEIDDRWGAGPGPRSGRLVGDGRLTATDVGVDAGAAGAEEAAVHVEENDEIRHRPSDGR